MKMPKKSDFPEEQFLQLPTEDIRRIVLEKGSPKVGIFIADGNRRLAMCRTRLSPTSDEFYMEYARMFAEALQKSIQIFFSHGLHTLFFPLFGPSLLLRKNKFQAITIPDAFREIFLSDSWLDFYKSQGIRVKAYGDLSQLENIDIHHLKMAEGVRGLVEKTSNHKRHTLFFGFMSENTPGLEMPQMIIDFFKLNGRAPNPEEMMKLYYGETIAPADFLILSEKLSVQGPMPPFIATQKAKIYYFPVPGFLGLTIDNFRKILYDLLYVQPSSSIPEYTENEIQCIDILDKFYQQKKDTIIGTVERIERLLVPKL